MAPPLSPVGVHNGPNLVFNRPPTPPTPVHGSDLAARQPLPTGAIVHRQQPRARPLARAGRKVFTQANDRVARPRIVPPNESAAHPIEHQTRRDIRWPAWLTWNLLEAQSSTRSAARSTSASIVSASHHAAIAERHHAQCEICSAHFSQIADSHNIAKEIVDSVEAALSQAFGRDLPAQFADQLAHLKGNAEQCRSKLNNTRRFAPANLAEWEADTPITSDDIFEVRVLAESAERIAVDCALRLADLAALAPSAHSNEAPNPEQRVDREKLHRDLATITSRDFTLQLIGTLPMEVRPLRVGKAALGLVVQTPEWLAEQLIPTLKKQQPTLYAQQVNRMLPTVGIIAAADKSAFNLRVKIKAVVRAAWSTIPVTDLAGNDATVSDLKAQLRKLESETDASFRHIEHAAEKSSRLVSHGARSWKNVQQSERDIREVQLLCNRAATAHTRLEALLSEARSLLHTQTHPDTGMTKLLKFLHLAPDTSDSDSELDT